MKAAIFLAFALVSVSNSHAEGLGCRNPDVPFGGVAIDAYAAGSVSGQLEQTEWDVVSPLPADGLRVASAGDFGAKGFGLSMMTSLSSRVTAQIHYDYAKMYTSDFKYTSVAPFVLGANHDLPYKTDMNVHTLKVRFRVWLGTSE